MRAITEGTPVEKRPLGRKLAWFVLLWLCGVAVISAVAFVIRSMVT